METIPEGAGVSNREARKLARFIMKKVAQKKEEIYRYELAKFALGESNDLFIAKKNAESLGRYAYEQIEAEKEKAKAAQQAKQAQVAKYQPMPTSILQQYEMQMQREQMERMRNMYPSQYEFFEQKKMGNFNP